MIYPCCMQYEPVGDRKRVRQYDDQGDCLSSDAPCARQLARLHLLCMAAGVYGVGFGILMLPAGLFVGPHILAASLTHIALGVGFLIAAFGLRRHRPWAAWTALLLASFVATVALIAIVQSGNESDYPSATSWGICFALFAILTASSLSVLLRSTDRRFSLRTLMVASTIIALLCGTIAMMARLMQVDG